MTIARTMIRVGGGGDVCWGGGGVGSGLLATKAVDNTG